MHFIQWKYMNSDSILLMFGPNGPIDNRLSLVWEMVWCQTDEKPLFGPLMAWFTNAYMCHRPQSIKIWIYDLQNTNVINPWTKAIDDNVRPAQSKHWFADSISIYTFDSEMCLQLYFAVLDTTIYLSVYANTLSAQVDLKSSILSCIFMWHF